MKKQPEQMPEDQRFHDTYLLLKKYRDVVWGLELSVQQVKRRDHQGLFGLHLPCRRGFFG